MTDKRLREMVVERGTKAGKPPTEEQIQDAIVRGGADARSYSRLKPSDGTRSMGRSWFERTR